MPFDEEQKKQVEEITKETFNKLNKSGSFTDRKSIDTPTDALSPVNRRFVTNIKRGNPSTISGRLRNNNRGIAETQPESKNRHHLYGWGG